MRWEHKEKRSRERGVAVVVVLAMVGLMTVLAVGMMGHVDYVRETAVGTAEADGAVMLADSAVQVAVAQLRAGTEAVRDDGGAAPWTSQPGQLTVWRMDGRVVRRVKLYSDARMVETGEGGEERGGLERWAEVPGRYVDLNAPVVERDGRRRFPIVDPTAAVAGDGGEAVEGFGVDARRAVEGTVVAERGGALPMPVQWIYQLEDGTLGTLDESGRLVTAGPGKPGKGNRITGRFAFWCDDETCKVNAATAGEGVFWDTPRADTAQERALAMRQPLRWEYHRQPGHPAAVCLSSVLAPGRRFDAEGFGAEPRRSGGVMGSMRAADFLGLLQLGRQESGYEWAGTSVGGTAVPEVFGVGKRAMRLGRLGEVEELVWEAGGDGGDGGREVAGWFRGREDRREMVREREFFLTTRSAAPETTLGGLPRVALWPIHTSTAERGGMMGGPVERSTAYDAAVAAASRVGTRVYCVQRSRPGDGEFDLRTAAGGANAALLDYLRGLTGRAVPGFYREDEGMRTFAEKYGSGAGSDREGILLGMLDYVRAANFSDGQLAADSQFPVLCPGNAHEGFGQVSPLGGGAGEVRGMGRMLTISEVALWMVCRAEVGADGRVRGVPSAANRGALRRPGQREVEVGMLLEAFVPSQGWADYRPYVSVGLSGGGVETRPEEGGAWPVMYLNGMALVPTLARPLAQSPADPPVEWVSWGGYAGVRCLSQRVIQFRPVVVEPGEGGGLAGLEFSGTQLAENAGRRFKLAVYDHPGSAGSGAAGRGDLVQVIGLEFPAIGGAEGGVVKVPTLPEGAGAAGMTERVLAATRRGVPLIREGDVVQSLVVQHGDYRMVAVRSRIDSASGAVRVFEPHPQWGRVAQAHSLREPGVRGDAECAGEVRGYIAGLCVASEAAPDWDGETGEGPEESGDFDNGMGAAPDGPYSNRPDDGHLAALVSGGVPYFSVGAAGMSVPPVSASVFSALRQIPSAVMFGSLPARPASGVPWRTLLFRPQEGHPGGEGLPDWLLLDNFWQPVVEPQPWSHDLETEGRVNLNQGLEPFRWIKRRTALHAVMKPETMMAIPDGAAMTYKNGGRAGDRFRHYVDVEATLALWDRERGGRPFLAAAEICGMPLVPEGYAGELSRAGLEAWWRQHRLTGDNSRERPYGRLLPHFTTRSNVYRVHFVAETIRGSGGEGFDAERDRVTAQRRGSCRVWRVLDASDPGLPDFAGAGGAGATLSGSYRWSTGDWREVRGGAGR